MATIFRQANTGAISPCSVFDAAEPAAGPIALAGLSHRVPYGFHGNWRAPG
jgi:carotenoid cleavage dioxygenase-like enzyme